MINSVIKLLFNKFVLRKNNGEVVKEFVQENGIVYIKLAQMLATQNYGNIFTDEDRILLSSVCDNCNPIPYEEIEKILKREYVDDLNSIFSYIDEVPLGSASISQVHRAILKDGSEVVLKVKRQDIVDSINSDICFIRKIMQRFGKLVNFKNFIGGNHALDLYLKWINEEIDFINEVENIKKYQKFANNVNGRINGTRKIIIPSIYEDYCTENIIVMEYIPLPTINQTVLTAENKKVIADAINNYFRLSFWALFNDQEIVFHGDPHSGNICVDENANIYFLDMGLLCVLNDEDTILCREFFLAVYNGDYEKISNMILKYSNMDKYSIISFKKDCKLYCEGIKDKNITYYFMDMVNICLKYEINPPNFLFSMTKAFFCLNGICNFVGNDFTAIKLLNDQVIEFFLKRSFADCKKCVKRAYSLIPSYIDNVRKNGLEDTITKIITEEDLIRDIKRSIINLQEVLSYMKKEHDSLQRKLKL